MKLLGDGVLAMFEPLARGPNQAERALKAALFICIVAQRFDEWLKRRFAGKDLPDFALGAVHTGAAMVCRINTGAGVDTIIIGDTVNVAARVEEQTKKVGASVVTTLDTLALAGPRFVPGKRSSLLVRGRAAPVGITEITALRPCHNVDAKGLQTYNIIAEAVAYNTAIIVRDRDRVLAELRRIRQSGQLSPLRRPVDVPIKIPGFKLLLRLAGRHVAGVPGRVRGDRQPARAQGAQRRRRRLRPAAPLPAGVPVDLADPPPSSGHHLRSGPHRSARVHRDGILFRRAGQGFPTTAGGRAVQRRSAHRWQRAYRPR